MREQAKSMAPNGDARRAWLPVCPRLKRHFLHTSVPLCVKSAVPAQRKVCNLGCRRSYADRRGRARELFGVFGTDSPSLRYLPEIPKRTKEAAPSVRPAAFCIYELLLNRPARSARQGCRTQKALLRVCPKASCGPAGWCIAAARAPRSWKGKDTPRPWRTWRGVPRSCVRE